MKRQAGVGGGWGAQLSHSWSTAQLLEHSDEYHLLYHLQQSQGEAIAPMLEVRKLRHSGL